jgi:hypothetical protein
MEDATLCTASLREVLAISRRILDLACRQELVRPPTCSRARGALRILDSLLQRGEIIPGDLSLGDIMNGDIAPEDVHHG